MSAYLSECCLLYLYPPRFIIRRSMIIADESYCGMWIISGNRCWFMQMNASYYINRASVRRRHSHHFPRQLGHYCEIHLKRISRPQNSVSTWSIRLSNSTDRGRFFLYKVILCIKSLHKVHEKKIGVLMKRVKKERNSFEMSVLRLFKADDLFWYSFGAIFGFDSFTALACIYANMLLNWKMAQLSSLMMIRHIPSV